MTRGVSSSSIAFIAIPISFLIHSVDNQTTLDSSMPTLPPMDVIAGMDPANISSISIDLDDVLAVVNRSESTPPPPTIATTPTYGDRAFMVNSHSMNSNYNKEDLMGRTLRVIVPKIEPPYVNYVNFTDAEKLTRGYGPGVVIEILKEIMHKLNLTYEIVETDTQDWGVYDNGNWSGAFGYMYRGQADILAGAAIMQYDRGLITDLTFPFQYAPTAMLIRSPGKYNDNTWLIVTQPFKWEVWGLTGLSIAVSGVILYFLARFLMIANEVQYTLVEALWVFFSVFVQQGLPVQPRSWACRVMLALWWLASITLMATFTGSLVALFAVDKITLPFNNIQQLVRQVQRGRWKIVMDGSSLTRTNMIKESESTTYKELWHEMTVNRRVTYVKGVEAGVTLLLTQPNMVLLGPEDSLQYYATINCNLMKLDEGILPTYLSIPLAKDSEYSTYFSTTIRDLVERGFVEKWINDYTSYMASRRTNAKCSNPNSANEKYLDLSKAQGAFWVLIGGISLGLTVLGCELVVRGIRKLFFDHKNRSADKAEHDAEFDPEKIKSFSTNTTSSVSSGSTGGEPEILKIDDPYGMDRGLKFASSKF